MPWAHSHPVTQLDRHLLAADDLDRGGVGQDGAERVEAGYEDERLRGEPVDVGETVPHDLAGLPHGDGHGAVGCDGGVARDDGDREIVGRPVGVLVVLENGHLDLEGRVDHRGGHAVIARHRRLRGRVRRHLEQQ